MELDWEWRGEEEGGIKKQTAFPFAHAERRRSIEGRILPSDGSERAHFSGFSHVDRERGREGAQKSTG